MYSSAILTTINESDKTSTIKEWVTTCSNREETGAMLLMHVYHEHPQLLSHPAWRGLTDDQIKDNDHFKALVEKTMSTVEQILSHLDDVPKIASMFEEQGKDYRKAGKSMMHVSACLETFLPLKHPDINTSDDYRLITTELIQIIKQSLLKGYRMEEQPVKPSSVSCCWKTSGEKSDAYQLKPSKKY